MLEFGASGKVKNHCPRGSAQDKSALHKCPRNSSRKPRDSPVSQMEVIPGTYETVSYEKYIVVTSVDGCSINDLDISFKYTVPWSRLATVSPRS